MILWIRLNKNDCVIGYFICLVTWYCLLLDVEETLSPGKKKVHFAGDSKENHGPDRRELDLKKTHVYVPTLDQVERTYTFKSRHLLGIRWTFIFLFWDQWPTPLKATENVWCKHTIGLDNILRLEINIMFVLFLTLASIIILNEQWFKK